MKLYKIKKSKIDNKGRGLYATKDIKDGTKIIEYKGKIVTKKEVEKKSIRPLAKIVSWASVGVDPSLMGLGPINAVRLAAKKAKWKLDEIDLFEINEAFAAQSIAVIQELGIDQNKVNVNGGAIALGHPIGASGARILVTLIHEMNKRKAKKGLATLCIGGGMGIAMCIECNL